MRVLFFFLSFRRAAPVRSILQRPGPQTVRSCCRSACAGQEVVLTSHIHNRVIPPVSWRCFSASQSSSVQKSVAAHSGWKHPETAIRSGLKFGSGFGSGPSSYVNERGSTPIHCSSAVCFRHGVLDADPLVHESWI